jgi:CheY-like chemotaxis protein
MENADVVIHDAQYTPEEYPAKKNWGHSTFSYVTRIAAAAKVKRLFLTHHDPLHNDEFLDRIEARAKEIAVSIGSPMTVSCAAEGYEETFEGSVAAPARTNAVASTGGAHSGSLLVLIIDDDEDLRVLARRALQKAGHRVIEAAGGYEGIGMIEQLKPDLVLLDLFMPPPDGFEILRHLRSREETRQLPVVVLTAHGDEESARTSFESGATDFLSKPFTSPQLDARVRSCFAVARRLEVISSE